MEPVTLPRTLAEWKDWGLGKPGFQNYDETNCPVHAEAVFKARACKNILFAGNYHEVYVVDGGWSIGGGKDKSLVVNESGIHVLRDGYGGGRICCDHLPRSWLAARIPVFRVASKKAGSLLRIPGAVGWFGTGPFDIGGRCF